MKTQILRFGMSGVVGYLVDSLVLYAAMALGMGFLRGRLVSFVCAVIVTFFLNRRYTFAEQLQQAAARVPLWREFSAYLAAMALGGLLNLATYWLVLMLIPHFPALFALAVGAGSLVGMVANFASAKWLVFAPRPEGGFRLPAFELTTGRCLLLVQIVFWSSHLHEVDLPGLYMDAVNPDYLAARTLNPELPNPVWLQPTLGLPVLGNLYHGVQTYYVGIPVFALLGFNMLALRVAQGLFASGILVMMQLVLQRAGCSLALACAGALGLATELAFIASFRTQMYIVMGGAFWLLLAIYLALGRAPSTRASVTAPMAVAANDAGRAWRPQLPWLFSGLCAGLAVYSYFVFLFFIPVFVVAGWWHTRTWRAVLTWLLGFMLGMQTYVLGYALAIIALGGIGPALDWIASTSAGLDPLSSEQTLFERAWYALSLVVISLQNHGNSALIFGEGEPGAWPVWKVRVLMLVPLLLIAFAAVRGWVQRNRAVREAREGLLASWHIALLPIVFVSVSMVFGNRLWAHHFSPLVPLSYVVLFIAIQLLQARLRKVVPGWVGVVLMAGFLVGNFHQQQVFFGRLTATGGTGLFSNAINRMSEDALNTSPDLVHVFPEWGFAMPFALLTGNRRTYEVYSDPETLQRLAAAGTTVRLYYWKAETESSYRDTLLAQGFRISNSGSYLQRDQNPAFYWLEASGSGAR